MSDEKWFAVFEADAEGRPAGEPISLTTVLPEKLRDGCVAIECEGDPRGKLWLGDPYMIFVDPPPPETVLTGTQFWMRFTAAERIGFRSSPDQMVVDLMETVKMPGVTIGLSDPRTIGGLQYLVSKELLTAERMAEILGA